MGASCLVILWHKIVLSSPIWFLVEVFAKKPWKWSLFSSIALTSLFPILMLVTLTLGSIIFGVITLIIVQCGLLTLTVASLISSAAVIAPVALFLTFSIYVIYTFTVVTARAVCWVLAFPARFIKAIQQDFRRVSASASGLTKNLCLWQSFKKRGRNNFSEVRSRAAQRMRQRSTQNLPESANERPQYQQGFSGYLELLKKKLREGPVTEESQIREKYRQASHSSKNLKGWLTWINQADSDSSISDSDYCVGTCSHRYEFQRSSSQGNSVLKISGTADGRSASSLSSDDETIKFTSRSGSDSFHTADEWLAEDYIGNVIPDYRDRESKLYDALLKRDVCHGSVTYMW